jgi:DNA-binding XRE family transcriptional regulator
MNNVTYSIHTLTKDELENILESLLFASSVDVCADWFKENSLKSLEIAKKIRKLFPEVTLENVYIYEKNEEKHEYNDEHSKEIIEFFPEIKKEYVKL